MNFWHLLADAISKQTGRVFTLRERQALSGGCINEAYRIVDGRVEYFVKINKAEYQELFAAEAQGLQEIASSATVRVPRPLLVGTLGERAFLVMEYIALGSADSSARLGEELACLHRVTRADFGWVRDNAIGLTPQLNPPTPSWTEFWRDSRLGYQLKLAERNGYGGMLQKLGERLMENLAGFFSNDSPVASLLHGDLWSGNYATDPQGAPVIYDPASYFGDRETDIAMTELFGGFSRDFYLAYHKAWPLDAAYSTRKTLYNLYHVLNHLNLFGGGYGRQAENMMRSLLAELS